MRKPDNRVGKLLAKKMSNEAMLEELYLSTLNRPPTASESSVLLRHVAEATDARRAWEDVHWTLINTKEFLFRHLAPGWLPAAHLRLSRRLERCH